MKKRMASMLLVIILVLLLLPLDAVATTLPDVDDTSVFLKQASGECTITTQAMIMRRKTILESNTNWDQITVATLKKVGWVEGAGVKSNYTYTHYDGAQKDISIKMGLSSISSQSYAEKMNTIKDQLDSHPEGIGILVARNGNTHAVLLTSYSNDTLYCVDPVNPSAGIITLVSSTMGTIQRYTGVTKATQNDIINNCTILYLITESSIIANLNAAPSGVSTLHIENEVYPTGTLTKGKNFGLYGIISSNYKLTGITGYLYDTSNNSTIYSYDSNPNATIYNINTDGLNNKFIFGSLKDGVYRYVVSASDASGTTKTLIDSTFTIGNVPVATNPVGISISDGTYYIEAYCGKVVEVADSSTSNMANVQIWENVGINCQKFTVTKSGNYYTLTNVNSGKVLDIADGTSKSGTNIWQYTSNGTDAQKWKFEDAGGGYYYIRSALGTYMDVYDGGTANGTNVWAYRFNGTDAQKFRLVSVESTSDVDLRGLGFVDVAKALLNKSKTELGLTDDWCCKFVGYCINHSTLSDSLGTAKYNAIANPITLACWICRDKEAGYVYSFSPSHSNRLKDNECRIPEGRIIDVSMNDFTPEAGDIVFFSWSQYSWDQHVFSHVGIVSEVDKTNKRITYIDGNSSSDGGNYTYVKSHSRSYPSDVIWGYLRLGTMKQNGPAHIHSLTRIAAVAPTCTTTGNSEYWSCTECEKYFSGSDASIEILESQVIVPALGHNYADGFCTRCGQADPNAQANGVHFNKTAVYFQGQYTDISADQWFTGSVANAFELGLMKGNSASTFNPYGDVTLAEAITMASRIHSIYYTGRENFDQRSGGAWYQTYLDYAYRNGIINSGYYNTDVTVKATRAQFAEILSNSLPDEALAPMNFVSDNAIPDVKMTDACAQFVYRLYRAGILTGGDVNGTFSPLTYITRAEAATIISRMAESDNRIEFIL